METNQERLIQLGGTLTPEELQQELAWCIGKVAHNMQRFGEHFPSAEATNGIYRLKANDDWTNGFWTGMLWLSYEVTKEAKFKDLALQHVRSFAQRLADHHVLDHHDIGFLYSLSTVAGYRILGDETCKNLTLKAADVLLARFQEKGRFLQAWGTLGDPKEYRLIIDSLLNLPLLFTATELSGDLRYREVAQQHYQQVLQTVIKDDGTTFHTYYFDPQTGSPTHGATHQGHGDSSIWARGQSWGVAGIPLNQRYLPETTYPAIYPQVVAVYLDHLPADLVPYWDFDFTDAHPSEKDSSAQAIAACGLLEADRVSAYPEAKALAKGMVKSLMTAYTSRKETANEGLLLHGVYAYSHHKGIDEPNLWGDYFYMEALMRLQDPSWGTYW